MLRLSEYLVLSALLFIRLNLEVVCDQIPFYNSNYADGRDVMVHLFEWRWEDIASECETYLGPMKFAGVQVSPPNENAVIESPSYAPHIVRPWYERYQPVSYQLITRSGDEQQFRDMVNRCNNAGVRIYVDAVINHMTGPLPNGTQGTGGSAFDSESLSYPAVPYGPEDFNSADNCNGDEAKKTRDCELVGLKDLKSHRDEVKQKIKDYLNNLLSMGVAGFRIDAAKHMWPSDLEDIYRELRLSPDHFPDCGFPLVFQEVISYSDDEPVNRMEYANMARVTEFRYGQKLSNVFRGNDQLRWLKNFGEEWNFLPSKSALVFVDNHDNQRVNDANVLTFFEREAYLKALTFMMAWPYGLKRIISSYRWVRNFQEGVDVNSWFGPPRDNNYNIRPVTIRSDGSCRNGWVCEHRWPSVARMVHFSVVSKDEPVNNWWDNGENQIAFSRGNKAFYAVNNDNYEMKVDISTGLPPGRYCDVITGEIVDGFCNGRMVTVDYLGNIQLRLPTGGEESILALHVEAMVEDFSFKYPIEIFSIISKQRDYQRTVILIYIKNKKDEWLAIKGGANYDIRPDCKRDLMFCAVPFLLNDQSELDPSVLRWDSVSNESRLLWTTNAQSHESYNQLNEYGPNYWILDVKMDCSMTHYGWFDFVVVSANEQVEPEIEQNDECEGSFRIETPYNSTSHIAMCGNVNVFRYASSDCTINYLNQ